MHNIFSFLSNTVYIPTTYSLLPTHIYINIDMTPFKHRIKHLKRGGK